MESEQGDTKLFLENLGDWEKIDQLLTMAEARRITVLREIERRRESFADRLRKASSDLIEGEFEEHHLAPETGRRSEDDAGAPLKTADVPKRGVPRVGLLPRPRLRSATGRADGTPAQDTTDQMTTASQREANRLNAKSSTGPRTAKGKAGASRGALKHGLNLSITAAPEMPAAIEALARMILGERDPEHLYLAREIAEAQMDLNRVRRIRHALLSRAFDDPDYDSPQKLKRKAEFISVIVERGIDRCATGPLSGIAGIGWTPSKPRRMHHNDLQLLSSTPQTN
jgi:hypothetical protein